MVGLQDWTIYSTGGSIVGVDPVEPIRETGSLRMVTDFTGEAANLVNSFDYTPGLTRGRMRMLIRIDEAVNDSFSTTTRAGLLFMQDTANMTTISTGVSYSCGISIKPSGNSHYFLAKENNGIETDSTAAQLFNSGNIVGLTFGGPGIGDIIPIEVEWKLETTLLAGILVTIRGSLSPNPTNTTFSNLTELETILITDPPDLLSSSIAEGLFFEGFDGSRLEVYMDDISINSLAPSP